MHFRLLFFSFFNDTTFKSKRSLPVTSVLFSHIMVDPS